ncbi:hypothetical protein HZS_2678, partial [Henneguya salminicola]
MSEFCDFQEFLDQALRDQFIMGFRDVQNNIRALLLAETGLSFKRIMEVAQRISSSSVEAKLIALAKPEIFRMALHSKSKPDSLVCYGRGENDHYRRDCPKQTERCGIKEHASKVCRKRIKDGQSINSLMGTDNLFTPAFVTEGYINEYPIKMEVDTG